jgi:hypothetical protein
MLLAPPLTPLTQLDAALQRQGHAVVDAAALQQALDATPDALAAWAPYWDRLPPDEHLRDGGRYRRRRHASFVIDGGVVTPAEHRAHWQPVEYKDATWQRLLRWLADRASALRGPQPWFAETHPFRIDTTDGIGRPTPEGAHRDGVDLVAVLLVARVHVKGGETRVFEAAGPQGLRFTMSAPWTLLLLDDARVIHETTPIQPDGPDGHRDTLVVTLRAGGFQGP